MIIQTAQSPFMSIGEVSAHVVQLKRQIEWTSVGIFYDDDTTAVLAVLIEDEFVVACFRFCLSVDESCRATQEMTGSGNVTIRCLQGEQFSADQLVDLSAISQLWIKAQDQSIEADFEGLAEFFRSIERESSLKGRGASLKTDAKRQVCFDAHGRCMFDGCGQDLSIDPVTGIRGTFSYLAHNVAAAEDGTRGLRYLSYALSDDPNNFLLLCDIHHRLVDTVAKLDYPAARLSDMRRRFCSDSNILLDGLKRTPIPAYAVMWPIRGKVGAMPIEIEIAESLLPINGRQEGQLNVLTDNESYFLNATIEETWAAMPNAIRRISDKLLMQTQQSNYRAALFALGLMPSLIALGASIGNKSGIVPMHLDRERARWIWPEKTPQGPFYTVSGVANLESHQDEIVLGVAITNHPDAFSVTATELGLPTVSVIAKDAVMGNSALSHPVDGMNFRHEMQRLLHLLADKHAVKRIHLLTCAPNAVSVLLGQAFDSFHPDVLIYDFAAPGKAMLPRLRLSNSDNEFIISDANV